MKVVLPPVIRGCGVHSGSAQLCILAALTTTGADVLCSAEAERVGEMLAEVLAVLIASNIGHGIDARGTAIVKLENGSRILFREHRPDGTGSQGLHPILVWLDSANRKANVEATEMVRRLPAAQVTV